MIFSLCLKMTHSPFIVEDIGSVHFELNMHQHQPFWMPLWSRTVVTKCLLSFPHDVYRIPMANTGGLNVCASM